MSEFILYNGPTSPFGRKVKIVSIVHEIDVEEKIINIYEADFLDQHNPLRKIPTLLINNLSIIDILMRRGWKETSKLINQYELIE